MQIILEVEDKEKALDAINNGMVSLSLVYFSFAFWSIDGLTHEWYEWWEKQDRDYDKCANILKERLMLLKDIYEQIEQQ